ncbi:MAG TPA: bifunctional riboflavin kinase/FAD synthetase [Dissulfurispiraceae bacterium]|nr:bifunctional riboflavin kinase/FAD synthetase [Dissulfurispiraceae bacterium]
MDVINGLPATFTYRNPVITIGNFDGVHIGHQKIFARVVEKALEIGGTPVAVTFFPHPVSVLAPERGLRHITTSKDKTRLIADNGLAVIIYIPFNREFAKTEPEDFIKRVLVDLMNARWVVVGHSYSFGKGKKGSTDLLRRKGESLGFGLTVVRHAAACGDVVSSSRVRAFLLKGKVSDAACMLGRAYHIDGVVVPGAGRGESILRTPTANLATTNEIIPNEGVYAVRVSTDGRLFDGVANIGSNPTFGGIEMSYEVHLFGVREYLVGKKLRVHFIERLRDEATYPAAEVLKAQIKIDIENAKEILGRSDLKLLA